MLADWAEEIPLKNGSVLLSLNGYSGEEDFYRLFDLVKELLVPEEASFGVDSMCVDGSFRKDGLLVRMSSECVTDCCCFHYDAAAMTSEEVGLVRGWLEQIIGELKARDGSE